MYHRGTPPQSSRTEAKKVTPKKLTVKEQKAKEQKFLAKAEAELVAKYGNKIVADTIQRGRKGSKYQGKLTVEIRTKGEDGIYDGKTLRIATSDVHQVNYTPEVAAALRRARRNERARQRRADARETAKV